jgi:glycosyltransferase involved in cell wall biosynthesis
MKNIWIVNDLLTCIPGTKTFWHLLLEIDGTVDKTGVPFNKLAETIENDPGSCHLIIRNGTFFREIQRDDCEQIVLIQDYYGYDYQQIEVASNADHVVFNSDFTKEKFNPIFDNFSVIPIGVNENLFKPLAKFRKENDIFTRFKRTGIFVGDYNATKNTRLFEEVVKENSHVDFIYVSKARNQINLPNVRNYPGGVDELGMLQLYNEADFCIMCSPLETLHLTTVEAALCDIPVIGTNTGWLADHFHPDVGIRIDGDATVAKFSHAIAKVLSSNYCPRQHMLSTPFTWEGCKKSWEKLIEEVLVE